MVIWFLGKSSSGKTFLGEKGVDYERRAAAKIFFGGEKKKVLSEFRAHPFSNN